MRYVAAYLLAALGGNQTPSCNDIKNILGSVGIDVDDDKLNKVISELKGKDIEEVLAAGIVYKIHLLLLLNYQTTGVNVLIVVIMCTNQTDFSTLLNYGSLFG